jgi:hypothetical protein
MRPVFDGEKSINVGSHKTEMLQNISSSEFQAIISTAYKKNRTAYESSVLKNESANVHNKTVTILELRNSTALQHIITQMRKAKTCSVY